MTKQTAVVDVSSFTTDAKFRAWGLAASTALQACGLVLTADTGQINWATVTKPVATNTKAGYEIYHFNDSLEASKPIFIRFDYGSNPGVTSGNGPGMWITVGTGSNGFGTITGTLLGPVQSGYSSTATPSSAAMTMQFTHSTASGYLLANFGEGSGTYYSCGFFILERTKDSTGASTGDGVGLTYASSTSTWSLKDQALNFNTVSAFTTARNPGCGVPFLYSVASGGQVPTYEHYIGAGIPFYAIGRLSYFSGDIALATSFSATPVGATAHTYQTSVGTIAISGADSSATSSALLAYLWED